MPPLRLYELTLSRDNSFGATRDPDGVAWISAPDEAEARRLLEEHLPGAVVASVEEYSVEPARVIGLREPGPVHIEGLTD